MTDAVFVDQVWAFGTLLIVLTVVVCATMMFAAAFIVKAISTHGDAS